MTLEKKKFEQVIPSNLTLKVTEKGKFIDLKKHKPLPPGTLDTLQPILSEVFSGREDTQGVDSSPYQTILESRQRQVIQGESSEDTYSHALIACRNLGYSANEIAFMLINQNEQIKIMKAFNEINELQIKELISTLSKRLGFYYGGFHEKAEEMRKVKAW